MRHTPGPDGPLLETLDAALKPLLNKRRWVVAFSGGLDSTALLHLTRQYLQNIGRNSPQLQVLHIHHGLNPLADDWQRHCAGVAEALDLPFSVQQVAVSDTGRGLEAAARRARYHCFETFLGNDDLLLLGHHADDQAETLLYRLLRGAGVAGLAAMPAQRSIGAGLLQRPLLSLPRAVLQEYAERQQLSWIDDDSNSDEGFDRNYLRHQILPLVEQRWPAYRQTLGRTAEQMRDAAEIIATQAATDYQACGTEGPGILSLKCLQNLSPARQRALLRHVTDSLGLPTPSAAHLLQVQQQLVDGREDSQACVSWPGVAVRRFDGRLFVGEALPELASDWHCQWRGDTALVLPAGGELHIEQRPGQGLRELAGLRVAYRQGGERCRPAGRAHSQSLKKLFQEYRVPPWLRDRAPLLYQGQQLVAVAGLWVCEGYQAMPGAIGYWAQWTLADQHPTED